MLLLPIASKLANKLNFRKNEGLAHIDPSHLEKQASVVAEVTSQDQHELDNPLLVVNENDMPCPCMSTA